MTADDVAFTLKRLFTEPAAYLNVSYPSLAKVIQIEAIDKYSVKISFTPETFMEAYHTIFTFAHIVAPEVVAKYGDVNKWKVQVGTGPFMVGESIPGSVYSYVRNPNYWMKDPIGQGTGNQLPYVDGIKLLVIPDASTRQAALRTGKLDQNSGYSVEDRDLMLKNAQEMKYKDYIGGGASAQAMKIYDSNLPFKDVNVRRAMMMAIDYEMIVKDYYKGAATYFNFPQALFKGYESIWVSLDDMPDSVKELYTYNPDKARQLLKEAGYPNGFQTSIVLQNTQENIDYMSIVAGYWSKVGIQVKIEAKETGTYNSIWRNFTYPEMIMAGTGGIGSYYRLIGISGPDYWNPSQVNEPYIEEVRQKMADIILTTFDWEEVDRLYRELRPRVIDQAYMIPSPSRYSYTLWWPWVKNYHGESNHSFAGPGNGWTRFAWVDQDLKKSMGY
jgi:peptide/nickel transport system substrate-binding protein